jgi:hypothetical protein
MVKQKSLYGSIATLHKRLGESIDVEPLDAGLAFKLAVQELYVSIGVVGEEVDCLFVQTLV